jgi:hypothetical protein
MVNSLRGSTDGHPVRVIFFDEAHALTSGAQDYLLKSIEDALPGVIFCFATTDRKKLKPALLSRLMKIRVHALTADDAVTFLQTTARKANLTWEREALYLLAAVHPLYMRDLVIALERLSLASPHIDVDLVRSIYDVSADKYLSDYCLALARGDQTTQTAVQNSWSEGIDVKTSLIQKFYLTVYYNDILGQHLVIDPLVHSLSEARQEFVSELCSRLQVSSPCGLAPYLQAILDFWRPTLQRDSTTLYLQLARFESFVNNELASVDAYGLPVAKPSGAPLADTYGGADDSPLWMSDHAVAQREFIDASDIAKIVNRASFFAQQHGRYLNAFFTLQFTSGIDDYEVSAVKAHHAFLDTLSQACTQAGGLHAGMGTMEREAGTIIVRILSYIDLTYLEPDALRMLCQTWQRTSGHIVSVDLSDERDTRAFHWDKIRELCGSFQKDDGERDLRRLLRVPKEYHRAAGPINHEQLFFSPLLSEPVLKSSCENGMTPISAMDDEAWDWIVSGWELKEYRDRKRDATQRQQDISALRARWQHNPDVLQKKIDQLHNEWRRRGAKGRPREWDTWW